MCLEKSVRESREKQLCRNQGQREESKEVLQVLEQSLQPGEETLVKQILPLKPMKDHGGVDIHPAALGASHSRAGTGALKAAGAFRSRLLAGAVAHGEEPFRSRFSGRTHTRALHS